DILLKKVEIKKDRRYFYNIKDVLGKKVRFSIRKGEPITYSKLQKEFLVLRNTNVEVIYKKKNFLIKLIGIALENGEFGDLIKVRNTSSGKIILCKVIGRNKAIFVSGRN
ncbi:MAG: flagella basal body P-ring formation protein FlgA, partial [Aquificota bacterium]